MPPPPRNPALPAPKNPTNHPNAVVSAPLRAGKTGLCPNNRPETRGVAVSSVRYAGARRNVMRRWLVASGLVLGLATLSGCGDIDELEDLVDDLDVEINLDDDCRNCGRRGAVDIFVEEYVYEDDYYYEDPYYYEEYYYEEEFFEEIFYEDAYYYEDDYYYYEDDYYYDDDYYYEDDYYEDDWFFDGLFWW
jgi:hypothetical protein